MHQMAQAPLSAEVLVKCGVIDAIVPMLAAIELYLSSSKGESDVLIDAFASSSTDTFVTSVEADSKAAEKGNNAASKSERLSAAASVTALTDGVSFLWSILINLSINNAYFDLIIKQQGQTLVEQIRNVSGLITFVPQF
jgi:hypothetical protein